MCMSGMRISAESGYIAVCAGLTVPAVLSALLVKSTAGFLTQPVRVAASSFTTGRP